MGSTHNSWWTVPNVASFFVNIPKNTAEIYCLCLSLLRTETVARGSGEKEEEAGDHGKFETFKSEVLDPHTCRHILMLTFISYWLAKLI